MANEISVQTDITTDPAVMTGESYTKTATTITGTATKSSNANSQMILEILDNAGVVIRRKSVVMGASAPLGTAFSPQITGLSGGTTYHCRMQRGDVVLADI